MPNNPLQGSGAISLGDINVEIEKSRASEIGIYLAESGFYTTLNPYSPSKPDGEKPSLFSEWYSYNHQAPPPYQIWIRTAFYDTPVSQTPCEEFYDERWIVTATLVDGTTGASIKNNLGDDLVIGIRTLLTNSNPYSPFYNAPGYELVIPVEDSSADLFYFKRVYNDNGIACVEEQESLVSVESIKIGTTPTNYTVFYMSDFPKSNYNFGSFKYSNSIKINTTPVTKSFLPSSVSLSDDTITIPSHGFESGEELSILGNPGIVPTGAEITFNSSNMIQTDLIGDGYFYFSPQTAMGLSLIYSPNHRLNSGDAIQFSTITGNLLKYTGNLFENETIYYAIRYSKNEFAVASSRSNAINDLPTSISFSDVYQIPLTPTPPASSGDTINISAGGMDTGTPVKFYGSGLEVKFQGTVTSATANTITATPGTPWTTNEFADCLVQVVAGSPGVLQERKIISNTGNTITVSGNWTNQPTNGTSFTIYKPLAGKTYYLIRVDANNIKLAESYANAMADPPVPITFSSLLPLGPGYLVFDIATANTGKSFKFTQIIESPLYVIKQDNDKIKLASTFNGVFPDYRKSIDKYPFISSLPINFTQQGTGTLTLSRSAPINLITNTINYGAHGFLHKQKVLYQTTGTAIGGLVSGNEYFIIRTVLPTSANAFQLALNLVNANAAIPITLTSVGSGEHTFTLVDSSYSTYPFFSSCGPLLDNVEVKCGVFVSYDYFPGSESGVYTTPDVIEFKLKVDGQNLDAVNIDNERIMIPWSSYLLTGTPVIYEAVGTPIGGLTNGATYYIINVESNVANGIDVTSIKLATTLANALAGTAINLTSTGSGTSHFFRRTSGTILPVFKVRNFTITSVTSTTVT